LSKGGDWPAAGLANQEVERNLPAAAAGSIAGVWVEVWPRASGDRCTVAFMNKGDIAYLFWCKSRHDADEYHGFVRHREA
jgi:hypothetical protein